MIYDTVTNEVHPVPYFARGTCIQHEAANLPDGFRIATDEEVLAAYPPAPEVVPTYSKLKIVEVIDGMGKLDDFAGMLLQASTRIQMRWQAATVLAGDDEDLQSVVLMMQSAWSLTDEQVSDILKQCEA